jgi:hypothetical protein
VANRVPLSTQLLRTLGALALIAYGAIGVVIDDLMVPTKKGVMHLHGLPAWVMAAAMLCGAVVLASVVIDHHDKRDNEAAYRRFGRWGSRLGWMLAGLSCGLLLAGVRYPEPSDPGLWRALAGVLAFLVVAAIGFASETAIESGRGGFFAKARPVGGMAVLGGFFMLSGTLAALAALPTVWWPTMFSSLVTATAGIVIAVIGRLIFAARDPGADAAPESAPAIRREPPLVRNWRPVRIGILLVIGLWAFWWVRNNQSDRWLAEDEAERKAAPAWKYRLDDFASGIPLAQIQKRLSADGFRMRCYGDLGRNEKVEASDTHVCWTLANNIDGIPSQVISFFFGPEGLRHIRIAFPNEQWPAVKAWFERFDGVPAGKFGKDAGGSDIIGRRGSTGMLFISEPKRMPAIMALWQGRERIAETACKSGEYGTERSQLLCNAWPAPATPAAFLAAKAATEDANASARTPPGPAPTTLEHAFAGFRDCKFPAFFHAPWDGKSHAYFTERGLRPLKEQDGLYYFKVLDAAFGLQVREVIVPGTRDMHALIFDAPLAEARKALKARFGSEFRPSTKSRAGEGPELSATQDSKRSALLCNEREAGV